MDPPQQTSFWDLPFKHKWLVSGISLVYGPLMHGVLWYYAQTQGKDFSPPIDSIGETYTTVAIIGYIYNVHWLGIFGKVKPPRIRNILHATQGATLDIVGSIISDAELSKRGIERFLTTTQFLGEEQRLRVEAEYFLRTGDLGTAIDYYTQYLDERKDRLETLDERIASPLTMLLIKGKARYRGNLQDVIEEAVMDLGVNPHRLCTQTLPKIREKYPILEIRILQAMFLSICQRPEAREAWREIEEETFREKKSLGESRNEVYEIDLPSLKEVIIIKKGKDCHKEWKKLQEIQKKSPGLIARPLALYEQDGEYVLITKRKARRDLGKVLQEENKQTKEEQVRKAIVSARRLHKLDIDAPIYNPSEELDRRLLGRARRGRLSEILFQEYKRFEERKRIGEERVTCHGDLYPSNILEGGILIDLERLTKASPWLDIETLLGAPGVEELDISLEGIPHGGKEFYEVHTALCQVGSFSQKKPQISTWYLGQVAKRLFEQGETSLKNALDQYFKGEA